MNSLLRALAFATSTLPKLKENAFECRTWRCLAMTGYLYLWAMAAFAQTPLPILLEIEIDNYVQYWDDGGDPSKFAADAKDRTATRIFPAFTETLHLADIVAVNGRPAKGTYIKRSQLLRFNLAMAAGQSIADISRSGGPGLQSFEILQPDGTPIGTIMTQLLVGGPAPPGSPAAITTGNGAIVGGPGAFLNIRGQSGFIGGVGNRNTSYEEDPSNRRVFGGGRLRVMLQLTPLSRPEIRTTATGPAVVHWSDFTVMLIPVDRFQQILWHW